jgi:lambda family phage minor tail protein L
MSEGNTENIENGETEGGNESGGLGHGHGGETLEAVTAGTLDDGGGGKANERNIREIAKGSLVRFYEIDLRRAGHDAVLYFHPGLNEFGGPMTWNGREYLPFPITIEGMEYDGQGRLPRPTLTVSNIHAGAGLNLGALVRAHGDLNGCTLTHRMTLARFLDAANFIDGNPSADPSLEFPKDIYIFERKAEETSEYIKFELASALDLEGQLLPKRTYNANYCPHRYRGALCSYTGAAYFNDRDEETTKEKDKCGKRLRSCELRFCKRDGETDEAALARGIDGQMPFGGFPSVGMIARS